MQLNSYTYQQHLSLKDKLNKGELYSVNPETGKWCRARLDSLEKEICRVSFVDYERFQCLCLRLARCLLRRFVWFAPWLSRALLTFLNHYPRILRKWPNCNSCLLTELADPVEPNFLRKRKKLKKSYPSMLVTRTFSISIKYSQFLNQEQSNTRD